MRQILIPLACIAWFAAGACGRLQAEVPLERVQWSAEFGVPTAGCLAGRAEYILLFDRSDPDAGKAFDRLSWYMHQEYKDDTAFAALAIGVGPAYGSPADGKIERFARGADDGGLLRAFAGDKPCVMLVFSPDGRLTDMRHASQVDDLWLHSLRALAKDATPLLDEGWVQAALRPALPWYLAGDLKRFLSAAGKLKGTESLGPKLGQRSLEIAQADAKTVSEVATAAPVRLLALQRLQALATDFPNVAGEAQKAGKAVKDDAQMKTEQAAWAGFLDYLAAMKREHGKKSGEAQKALLIGLIGKFPGTYAAEVAAKIAAFAKIELK